MEAQLETEPVVYAIGYKVLRLEDGRLAVPDDLLKKLGWTRGSEVELFVVEGGQLILRDRSDHGLFEGLDKLPTASV